MLLIIRNLPKSVNYNEVKELIRKECGITDVILDDLMIESSHSRKVTVGLHDDHDSTILINKLNGFYYNGHKLSVNDVRQKPKIQTYQQPFYMLPNEENKQNYGYVTNMQNSTDQDNIPGMQQPPSVYTLMNTMYNMTTNQASDQAMSFPSMMTPHEFMKPTYPMNMSSNNAYNGHSSFIGVPQSVQFPATKADFIPVKPESTYESHDSERTPSRYFERRDESHLTGSISNPKFDTHKRKFDTDDFKERKPEVKYRESNYSGHRYDASRSDSSYLPRKHSMERLDNNNREKAEAFWRRDDYNRSGNRSTIESRNDYNQSGKRSFRRDDRRRYDNSLVQEKGSYRQETTNSALQYPRNVDYSNNRSRSEKYEDRKVDIKFIKKLSVHAIPLDKPFEPDSSKITEQQLSYRVKAAAQIARDMVKTTGMTKFWKKDYFAYLKKQIRCNIAESLGAKYVDSPTEIEILFESKDADEYGDFLRRVLIKYYKQNPQKTPKGSQFPQRPENTPALGGNAFKRPAMPADGNVQEKRVKPNDSEKPQSKKMNPGASLQSVRTLKKITPTSNPCKLDRTSGKPVQTKSIPKYPIAGQSSQTVRTLIPINLKPNLDKTQGLPKYPGADKKLGKELKKQAKVEFQEDEFYTLEQNLHSALNIEMNVLVDLFIDEYEKLVKENDGQNYPPLVNAAKNFKKAVKIHVSKRLLNKTDNLVLRVYATPKPPPRIEMEKLFVDFGIVSFRKTKKNNMFLAHCDCYKSYDTLCSLGTIDMDGINYKFRPLNVTGPPLSYSQRKALEHGEPVNTNFEEDHDLELWGDNDYECEEENDQVTNIINEDVENINDKIGYTEVKTENTSPEEVNLEVKDTNDDEMIKENKTVYRDIVNLTKSIASGDDENCNMKDTVLEATVMKADTAKNNENNPQAINLDQNITALADIDVADIELDDLEDF